MLLICYLMFQCYGIYGMPDVNLKFFKNVKANYSLLSEIHDAVMNFKPIMLKSFNTNTNAPINYEINDNITKEIMNTHIYKTMKNHHAMLRKYKSHAIKKGIANLKAIPSYMELEFQIKKTALPLTHMSVKSFNKSANKLFDRIFKQKCLTDLDKELLLLNTVQKFNGLLHNEEVAYFNDVVFKHNISIPKNTVMVVLTHFYNELNENKRDDMNYLCLKFGICKPFPGFTDYISDILRELLKLSDIKLTNILMKLVIHMKQQSNFFKSILGESSVTMFGRTVKDMILGDVSGVRKILIALRSYLAKRHTFIHNSDDDVNERNKALRIVVDIIDKSFDLNGDELLAMHFDMILKSIRDWSEGRKNRIDMVLKSFVANAVGIMENNINDETKIEMKALIDVLMRKQDRNDEIYQYLFFYGSKFVRGEDIESKLSLLL